jgi:hypothetical protein
MSTLVELLTPRTVYLFSNGMVAVCDAAGQQIPELQGRFSTVVADIMTLVDEQTIFHGWPDIVEGGKLGDWRVK